MNHFLTILGWLAFVACAIGAFIRRGTDPVTAWLQANGLYMPVMTAGCVFITAMSLLLFVQVQRDGRGR